MPRAWARAQHARGDVTTAPWNAAADASRDSVLRTKQSRTQGAPASSELRPQETLLHSLRQLRSVGLAEWRVTTTREVSKQKRTIVA